MRQTSTCKTKWRNRMLIFLIVGFIAPTSSQGVLNDDEPDQCPNTLMPDGLNGYKMISVDDEETMCCGCNPGFRYKGPCESLLPQTTQCVPCPPGEFISQRAHKLQQCQRHKVCSDDERVISQGNWTHDTECRKCPTDLELRIDPRLERCSPTQGTETGETTVETATTNKVGTSMKPPWPTTTIQTVFSNLKTDQTPVWNYLGPFFAAFSVLLLCILIWRVMTNSRSNRGDDVEGQAKENDDEGGDSPVESDPMLNNECKTKRNNGQDSGFSTPRSENSRNEMVLPQEFDSGQQADLTNSSNSVNAEALREMNVTQKATPIINVTLDSTALSNSFASQPTRRLEQYKKEMMRLCYALAKVVVADNIRPFFRELFTLSDAEVEIRNLRQDLPREQFISLFRILVQQGEAYFTPQHIVDVCCKNGWMDYVIVVREQFPDVQVPVCLRGGLEKPKSPLKAVQTSLSESH
ncbi:uncharacterized protein LOC143462638 isoform X2 [Clavelina lepadiformis]|uniref:uncharacterized protein LOC143462638 isoform X2 n=1 Tax=Clavelina lepadiformis TaxID=159417 RepID=UPI004040FEDF